MPFKQKNENITKEQRKPQNQNNKTKQNKTNYQVKKKTRVSGTSVLFVTLTVDLDVK